MYNTKSQRRRRFFLTKKFLLVVGFVLVIIIVMLVLELTNTTHIFHKKTVPATIPVSTRQDTSAKASQTQTKKSASSTTNSAQSSAVSSKLPSSGSSSNSSLVLTQPYGDFVSSHSPAAGTQEQSACDSTPGATCYIQFTNADTNVTTKLPAQTVGDDGSTIWSWNTGTLTSGNWEITAVASLGSQTKSATDTVKLVIQ